MILVLVLGLAALGAGWGRDAARRRRAEDEREALRVALDELRREREQDREQARAAERAARVDLERAARARDDLVSMVSHELRTPLNAVLGWTRLLRSGRLDAAGAARGLEALERNASAQAQIVDDLLDMARIRRGELRLDVRRVELEPLVQAALAAVRPAAEARGISLTLSAAPRMPSIAADPGRLQQIVWNLLSNAVKFTPPGGRVEIRIEEDEGGAVVRVRDSGEGIDPAFLAHVFEPFRQADSSTTRPHGGLGLGLAIVRHLVEAHGGTVVGESGGRGRGAVFTVRLPRAADVGPALSSPPAAPAGRGRSGAA